jgi:phosphate/sulfate permease
MGVPVALLASAALSAYQIYKSESDSKKAEKNFDKYEIPSGVNAMLDVMKSLSTQTELPGSDLLRSRQMATTAQGVETAQRMSESDGDVLGLLSEMYGKQLDSAEKMAIQGAEYYAQNRARYANALNTLGQYQTEKWKYNELYPYMQKMTGAGQTAAAGSANISGGIGSAIDIYGGQENMKFQDKMMGEFWKNKSAGYGEPKIPEVANDPFDKYFTS